MARKSTVLRAEAAVHPAGPRSHCSSKSAAREAPEKGTATPVAAEYPRFDLAAAIRAAGLEEVDPEVWAELGGDQTSDALADLISHSEVDRAALEKSCLGVDSSFHVPAFGAAQALVWEHWDGVWRFAAELLERGTIHGSDFESVLSGGKARGEPGR